MLASDLAIHHPETTPPLPAAIGHGGLFSPVEWIVTIVTEVVTALPAVTMVLLLALGICCPSVAIAVILPLLAVVAMFALTLLGVGIARLALHACAAKSLSPDAIHCLFRQYVSQTQIGNPQALRRIGCACHFEKFAKIAMNRSLEKFREMAAETGYAGTLECQDKYLKEFEALMKELQKPAFSTGMRYQCMGTFLEIMDRELYLTLHPSVSREQPPKFDHVSFSGGGAKGLGYLALLKQHENLVREGYLAPDCCFSGASIGALSAACAAFNVPTDAAAQAMTDVRKACLRPSTAGQEVMYPKLAKGLKDGLLRAFGVVEVVDKVMADQVRDFLNNVQPEDIAQLSPEEQTRIGRLREPFFNGKFREPYMVRFNDLEILRKLPGGKEKFQFLSVAVHDCDKDSTIFLHHGTAPNWPIAYALRMSMALPGAFHRVVVSIPDLAAAEQADPSSSEGLSEGRVYADGGVSCNLPLEEAFAAVPDAQPHNILGLLFDKKGSRVEGLNSPPSSPAPPSTLMGDVLNKGLQFAGFTNDFAKNEARMEDRVRGKIDKSPQSILFIPHGEVGTLGLLTSEEVGEAICYQGELSLRLWKLLCCYPDLSHRADDGFFAVAGAPRESPMSLDSLQV
jgi:predicted acylesterase/phospholipase RssA